MVEEGSEKPDLIKDENRFYEDLDKMTDTYSLKNLLHLFMQSHDYNLETLVLSIIFKCFSQRSALIKNLRNTYVIFSEKEIGVHDYCSTKIHELRYQIDQSEIWLLGANKNVKIIDSVNSTLQDLANCLYGSTLFDIFANKLVNAPEKHSDDLISRSRQKLMHSIELHKVLMNLIKDGTYILEGFTDEATINSGMNFKVVSLFKNCYMILILMCRNDYKEAKKALVKFMSIFSMQLPLLQVGQSELICEIFKESHSSTNVTDSLIETFYDNIVKKGHNPSYLRFFETLLQETVPEVLQENINKIIAILNDAEKRYKFLFMELNEKRNQYEFSLKMDDRRSGDFPFTYHLKVIEILLTMLEKTENVMLVRLIIQKLIPMNAVLRVMQRNDGYSSHESNFKKDKALLYSLIKRTFVKFFNVVWLDSDRCNPTLINNKMLLSFIDKEARKLENINVKQVSQLLIKKKAIQLKAQASGNRIIDTQYYTLRKKDDNVMIMEDTPSKEAAFKFKIMVDTSEMARFAYDYISYTLNDLLPIMIKLNLMFTSPEHDNMNERKLDLVSLLSYSTAFKSNFYKIEKLSMESYIYKRNVDEFIQAYQIVESDLTKADKNQDIGDLSAFETTEEPQVKSVALAKFQGTKINQNEAIRVDSCLMNHTYIDEKDDANKQKLWKSFVLNLSLNETVRKFIKQERNALLQTLLSIETLEFENHIIAKEAFIRKLILYIQNSTENMQDLEAQEESINGSIILLTELLSECKSESELIQMQSMLHKCQAVKIACNVFLKNEIPEETQKLMIYFCTKLLHGGNTEIQMAFYNTFKTDPNSENFFYMIYHLLMEEITANGREFTPTQKTEICMQNWDYVDEHFQFKLPMVLRLMQLFAENHNSELQAYFREQTNSKNNYNMISLLVRLAEALITNLNEEKYETLLQCIDTLTEFIQGPCYENQASLANSKFIELAGSVLEVLFISPKL